MLAVLEAEKRLLDSAITALDQMFIDWVDQQLDDPFGISAAGIKGI
jgi:hypothetical protein